MLSEVIALSEQIFHVLYGVFISCSEPSRPFLHLYLVSQISRYDVVLMLIVRALLRVVDIFSAVFGRLYVAVVFRAVVSYYVFHSAFHGVHLAYRCGVVDLKRVFGRPLTVVAVLVFEPADIVFPSVVGTYFVVVSIVVARVRVGVYFV